jgi:hypothetical protein
LVNSKSLQDPGEAFPTGDEDVAKGTKQQSSCDLGKQQSSCGLGKQGPDDPGSAVSNGDEDVERRFGVGRFAGIVEPGGTGRF